VQLLVVSAVVAAAKIAFNAASGAYLKALVRPDDLLVANARFESTTWSSIAIGPPLGGAAVGLSHPDLRALCLNQLLVGGLIMATEPLLAVLLLGELGFPPWQYGLAFAAPCLGGLVGSRLARRIVARYGQHRILRTVGTLRAVWLIGLAFVQPGVAGLATVIAVELAIIISMGLYNPVLATYRLERTPKDRIARTLSAWSISSSAAIAILSALGGLLAEATSPRTAITVAGLLILASPLLLPRRVELVAWQLKPLNTVEGRA
jgi:MFS family permease